MEKKNPLVGLSEMWHIHKENWHVKNCLRYRLENPGTVIYISSVDPDHHSRSGLWLVFCFFVAFDHFFVHTNSWLPFSLWLGIECTSTVFVGSYELRFMSSEDSIRPFSPTQNWLPGIFSNVYTYKTGQRVYLLCARPLFVCFRRVVLRAWRKIMLM